MLLLAEEHLERLAEGAKALDMELGLGAPGAGLAEQLGALQQMLYDTVDANGMTSGARVGGSGGLGGWITGFAGGSGVGGCSCSVGKAARLAGRWLGWLAQKA